MSDPSKAENAQTAHEARRAVASRPQGSMAAGVDAAMRRYLSAEHYHELKAKSERDKAKRKPATDDH